MANHADITRRSFFRGAFSLGAAAVVQTTASASDDTIAVNRKTYERITERLELPADRKRLPDHVIAALGSEW